MKQVLVIGGSGYLGSEIVSQLTKKGYQPIVFDIRSVPFLEEHGVKTVLGDVTNFDELDSCMRKLGDGAHLIHCASMITIERKDNPLISAVNVQGVKNTLKSYQELNLGRLVYVSSVHALSHKRRGLVKREIREFDEDRVHGQYAKSKAKASAYVVEAMDRGDNIVMVHPSGIIGPALSGEGQTTPMIRSFLKGKMPMIVSGGYDFVDVRDVAEGVISALERGKRGENYILSGDYYSVKEILDMAASFSDLPKIKTTLPMNIFKVLAPIVEWGATLFKKKPPLTGYMAFTLSALDLYSHNKASKELGYRTRPMEETIYDVVKQIQKEIKSE